MPLYQYSCNHINSHKGSLLLHSTVILNWKLNINSHKGSPLLHSTVILNWKLDINSHKGSRLLHFTVTFDWKLQCWLPTLPGDLIYHSRPSEELKVSPCIPEACEPALILFAAVSSSALKGQWWGYSAVFPSSLSL